MIRQKGTHVDKVESGYTTLARQSTHTIGIGSALISMVEPQVGLEREYNRWYEDDHFYAGAMYMPWMYSGRRFVATRDLQSLRYPESSAIAEPLSAGCYLHLYWITPDHNEDQVRWSVATNEYLRANDRIDLSRRHVYTSFQDYVGTWYRDVQGPRDFHALDYPYAGVVMEVLDAPGGAQRADVDTYLRDTYLPWLYRTPDNPIAQTIWFAPQPLPGDKMPDVADIPGIERRMTVLHFLDCDPRACWDERFAEDTRIPTDSVVVQLVAPFIPVLPGTDLYVDQLR